MPNALRLTLVALSVLAAGCSDQGDAVAPSTTAAVATPPCSAAALSEDVPEPDGIPVAVAMMRKEILKAAVRCDYDLLEALARRGDPGFDFTYGGAEGGPAALWRTQEAAGEAPIAAMVKVLSMPYVRRHAGDEGGGRGRGPEYFAWPSADQPERTERDWTALRSLYTEAEVEQFRRSGLYTGYRLAITADGDWVSFIAGD